MARCSAAVAVTLLGAAAALPARGPALADEADDEAVACLNDLLELRCRLESREGLDRNLSPTASVNRALVLAARPGGAAAIRRAMPRLRSSEWPQPCAAEAGRFLDLLLVRAGAGRVEPSSVEWQVLHGFAVLGSMKSVFGGGGNYDRKDEIETLLRRLDGAAAFREPLRPDPDGLLRAIRSRAPEVRGLLDASAERPGEMTFLAGFDASCGIALGESAGSDPAFAARLLRAARGQDGEGKPEGIEDRVLLVAMGRWGSQEAVALLAARVRSVLGMADEDEAAAELRFLGRTLRHANARGALAALRRDLAEEHSTGRVALYDWLIDPEGRLRELLRGLQARPGAQTLEDAVQFLMLEERWGESLLGPDAIAEGLESLVGGRAAAPKEQRPEWDRLIEGLLRGLLDAGPSRMDGPPTLGTLGKGATWTAERLGHLPDAATAAEALLRARREGGATLRSTALHNQQLPLTGMVSSAGGPPRLDVPHAIRACISGRTVRVRIENLSKVGLAVDPMMFRLAEAHLYRGRTAGGAEETVLAVALASFTNFTLEVRPDALRTIAPGASAEFEIPLPPSLPEGTTVYLCGSACRVGPSVPALPFLGGYLFIPAQRP